MVMAMAAAGDAGSVWTSLEIAKLVVVVVVARGGAGRGDRPRRVHRAGARRVAAVQQANQTVVEHRGCSTGWRAH